MKVKKFIALLLISIINLSILNYSSIIASTNKFNNKITNEEYISTIRNLLYPYLSKEVKYRYGEYAQIDRFDMNINNISILPDSKVNVEITIKPFLGAHNTISTDKATFLIGIEEVQIIKYITLD